MMDRRVGHTENTSASDDEIMNSLKRKASKLVPASEIPTVHRAIATAAELREYPNENLLTWRWIPGKEQFSPRRGPSDKAGTFAETVVDKGMMLAPIQSGRSH